MAKPFSELTTEEATVAAKEAVRHCCTVHEIRQRLTAIGFDGDAAEINFCRAPSFTAHVKVPGPRGETIYASHV